MNIEDIKEKVLGTLDKRSCRSMTNKEILIELKKPMSIHRDNIIKAKDDVNKAIRKLRSEGKIISYGGTAARRHMLLSTAKRVWRKVERLKKGQA